MPCRARLWKKLQSINYSWHIIRCNGVDRWGFQKGKNIEEGNLIATIQKTKTNNNLEMLPHLHISLGWIHKSLPVQELDWPDINKRKNMHLVDPLPLLQEKYIIKNLRSFASKSTSGDFYPGSLGHG